MITYTLPCSACGERDHPSVLRVVRIRAGVVEWEHRGPCGVLAAAIAKVTPSAT